MIENKILAQLQLIENNIQFYKQDFFIMDIEDDVDKILKIAMYLIALNRDDFVYYEQILQKTKRIIEEFISIIHAHKNDYQDVESNKILNKMLVQLSLVGQNMTLEAIEDNKNKEESLKERLERIKTILMKHNYTPRYQELFDHGIKVIDEISKLEGYLFIQKEANKILQGKMLNLEELILRISDQRENLEANKNQFITDFVPEYTYENYTFEDFLNQTRQVKNISNHLFGKFLFNFLIDAIDMILIQLEMQKTGKTSIPYDMESLLQYIFTLILIAINEIPIIINFNRIYSPVESASESIQEEFDNYKDKKEKAIKFTPKKGS